MSFDIAIQVSNLEKHYLIYDRPQDRLRQMVLPKIQRLFGLNPQEYFRSFPAVRPISFEIRRGETLGIVGRNGSGKSTLLQMICGTLQPSNGAINVNGRVAALLELGSGFNPEFTGRENVFLNAAILGLTDAETAERFEAIESFAKIGEYIDQPVKTYSSGMYVRLAFAVATNVDADILIVDEALAVGDEAFQRKCFAKIEEISARGGTILFVSHGAQSVVNLCDRAIMMDKGELIVQGAPKEVIKQYHRFLNTEEVELGAIREELKRLPPLKEEEPAVVPTTPLAEMPLKRDIAWFDESLVTDSAVDFGTRGATISDILIERSDGAIVNVLTEGVTYTLRYRVTFDNKYSKISFGMMIKTISGIELGGTGTSLREDLLDVERAGQCVEIGMQFDCNLQPGTYFANVGVGCHNPGDHIVLHRILDAICFRVEGEKEISFSGSVDFGVSHSITIEESDGVITKELAS